jgi:hypothetical protein
MKESTKVIKTCGAKTRSGDLCAKYPILMSTIAGVSELSRDKYVCVDSKRLRLFHISIDEVCFA